MLFFKKSLPPRDSYGGLIGCGFFVKYAYVPALNHPDNPVVCSGLYSRSKESAQIVQKILNYKTSVFASYEELVNSGIKFVIITAPNYLHRYYIAESLKRNLDVFCEKPPVINLKDAFELRTLLKNSGNILLIGFNRRYLDKMKVLKRLIEEGEAGSVRQVNISYNQDIKEHILKSDWLSDKNKSGGGVLYNAGIHWINAMLDIFGKVDKVSAEFINIKLAYNCGEDTASCRFIFRSGVKGFLEASFVNALDCSGERITIEGNKATISTNMQERDFSIRDKTGHTRIVSCPTGDFFGSIYNEMVHFAQCIKTRGIPLTDIDDSIETLRVAEAARLSAIENREISLDEVN
jgi:predicted dehydrogenase